MINSCLLVCLWFCIPVFVLLTAAAANTGYLQGFSCGDAVTQAESARTLVDILLYFPLSFTLASACNPTLASPLMDGPF